MKHPGNCNIGRLQSMLVTAQRTADTINLYVYVNWKLAISF